MTPTRPRGVIRARSTEPELSRPATLLALLAALLALAACGGPGGPSSPPVPVPVDGAPVTGPADAWVTVVEFADFQCPYCRNVQPALAEMLAAYPEDVRLVFRHFPLEAIHPRARPAARAAECAFAQDHFFEMAARVFTSSLDDSTLAADAASAGVPDLDAWTACLTAAATDARIDGDLDIGRTAGVPATPTFFVNGVELVGSAPYETFRDAVEQARAKAIASGIPRADYYRRAVLGLP